MGGHDNQAMQNLEKVVVNLTIVNEELEDKFDKVANFLICVIHLVVTTLHLLHTTNVGDKDEKDA